MIFHAKRCYSIKNLIINGNIVRSKELSYKVYKENSNTNNIYLIRKYNVKKKKRKIF